MEIARTLRPVLLAFAGLLAASCAPVDRMTGSADAASPQDAFFAALTTHCGRAYAGKLVTGGAPDAAMRGRAMVMHVRECSDTAIAIPFHVERPDGSWDRSRTWLVTRTGTGLRLKHDHRHEDGSADAVTFYGGDTAEAGTARAQDFPVDAESIALFRREGLGVSVTNIWRVEIDSADAPAPMFAYQLRRVDENARNFRVEFDAGEPVTPPPTPWGWE